MLLPDQFRSFKFQPLQSYAHKIPIDVLLYSGWALIPVPALDKKCFEPYNYRIQNNHYNHQITHISYLYFQDFSSKRIENSFASYFGINTLVYFVSEQLKYYINFYIKDH